MIFLFIFKILSMKNSFCFVKNLLQPFCFRQVTLTLWGAEAENFDGTNNPVVVVKGARISEFGGGKSLSSVGGTNIKINPDIKECYRIRGWYDGEGSHIEATNISAKSGLANFSSPWMSFKEVTDQGLGNGERGDYYQVMGTILLMRSENAVYKACPTPECNKKVIDLENGMYRCEKCNREFPNFKYRLLASVSINQKLYRFFNKNWERIHK